MSETKQRALSARQAFECETAVNDRCRCRCGGKLHGAKRIAKRDELNQLEPGDPHRPEPMDARTIRKKLRRIERHAMNAAVAQVPMSVGGRIAVEVAHTMAKVVHLFRGCA